MEQEYCYNTHRALADGMTAYVQQLANITDNASNEDIAAQLNALNAVHANYIRQLNAESAAIERYTEPNPWVPHLDHIFREDVEIIPFPDGGDVAIDRDALSEESEEEHPRRSRRLRRRAPPPSGPTVPGPSSIDQNVSNAIQARMRYAHQILNNIPAFRRIRNIAAQVSPSDAVPPFSKDECTKMLKEYRVKKGYVEDICAICRESEDTDQTSIVLACGHFFHEVCITEWCLNSAICPTCRDKITV